MGSASTRGLEDGTALKQELCHIMLRCALGALSRHVEDARVLRGDVSPGLVPGVSLAY